MTTPNNIPIIHKNISNDVFKRRIFPNISLNQYICVLCFSYQDRKITTIWNTFIIFFPIKKQIYLTTLQKTFELV